MQLSQENKTPSVQASQDYSTRIFLFALELIPYFGIPAAIGLYVHKRLAEANVENTFLITAAIFLFTYVCSWTIVIFRYRAIKRQYQK